MEQKTTTRNGGLSATGFTALEEYAGRLSLAALSWAIWDCQRTIRAMGAMDPCTGKYFDQISVFRQEITRRRQAPMLTKEVFY